jgi:tRNA(Ile)-lysidine synthase
MSLYSHVLGRIRRQGLLSGTRAAVVGLSGGPDSVCLFDLLARMVERGDLVVSLHVAHLHHGLRGAEADADEAFARDLAASRRVPITTERRDVRAARDEAGGSLEEAARRERYAFLEAAAATVGAGAVAVGHNADDQVETVLHRVVRGTGLRGLRGMAARRPIRRGSAVRLVRPLLGTRRAEILGYLRRRGLSFREDSSNRETAFLRNRVRAELLPLLEAEYNPAVREAILRLSSAAGDAWELLCERAEAEAEGCVAGASLDMERFHRAPAAVKPLLVDRALAATAPDAPQLDAVHYEAVIELARVGQPGSRIELPGGLAAVWGRAAVTFGPAPADGPPAAFEVPLGVPGQVTVPGGWTVTAAGSSRSEFDLDAFLATKTRYDEVMDAGSVSGPLVVRTRREGDRFHPLGSPGRKTVGDFLTDRKVPPSERGAVLIVAGGADPVWVVGHRMDERVKVTHDTTRVLKLFARKERGSDGKGGC